MKVLWVCNIVFPEFAGEFGIKKNKFGGWMPGMLNAIRAYPEIEVGLCFPIFDECRMKSSRLHGISYYCYHAEKDALEYDFRAKEDFLYALEEYQPDIVHIWGTEYYHAKAMQDACKEYGIQNRVVIDIQGLVSVYAKHYASGIPSAILEKNSADDTGCPEGILNEMRAMEKRGENELEVIRKAKYIFGRTDWDDICVHQVNPEIVYMKCNRILRDAFYECSSRWQISRCARHMIFISQASYPIKGFHFLLRALPFILREYPDTEVFVAGKNPIDKKFEMLDSYGKYLYQLIRIDGIADKIHFVGILDEREMIPYFLSANVFVSPSVIENNSNSICEAMYLGTPVISSDVGGISSILTHRYDGILYPCDAEYMLAGWVCRIFGDDELAGELSEHARITASARHDIKEVSFRMIKNYKKMIEAEENRDVI